MNAITLKGEKVYIKQPEFKHMEYIRKLWSDEETMKDVGGVHIIDDEKAKSWFDRICGEVGEKTNFYCIIYNLNNEPVGEVSFHRYDEVKKRAGLNIKIDARYRQHGYGKEALKLLLVYYFNEFGGEIMQDGVAINNKIGQRALLNFGFEHTETTEEAFVVEMSKEKFSEIYN